MESNGRLISETKLITTLAKKFKGGMIHYEDIFAAIADVPTADAVEVVHGYWYKAQHHPYRCSNCGEMALLDMYGESHYRSNYCPYCGAKMDGGNEDGVKFKERCKKCFHFQVCANVLQNDLFIREVMLGEKEPECKQFVEVVRCKDCKHYKPRKPYPSYGGQTKSCCRSANIKVSDDNFCSYGEREGNDNPSSAPVGEPEHLPPGEG